MPPKRDFSQIAFDVVRRATEGADVVPSAEGVTPELTEPAPPVAVAAAAAMKKLGARGGKARAAKLTPEQRAIAARVAADARWKKG